MSTATPVETQPERDPREDWLSVTRVLQLAGLTPWKEVDLDLLRRGTELGLKDWDLRYLINGADPNAVEAKREIGIYTHQAIADIERGMTEPWWEGDRWEMFISAYQRFKSELHYQASLIEHRVYNETYQYRGDLDSVGMLNGKTEALIDVKTALTMDASMGYQLAGYDACLPANPKRLRLGLQLFKDGSYKVHEYKDKNDLKVFLAALIVATIKKGLQ